MFVLLYVIWARVVNLVEILLVIYALLSWFPGAYDTAFGKTIRQIVQPILAPFRRSLIVLLVLIFQLSQLYFC